MVPGPSVRLSHSRRLKSQMTFKTDSKGVDLLDVKLSPPDGDELMVIKGGILPANVELLLGKFLNLLN